MPTIEEITAWSNTQLLAELKAVLPKDWELSYGWNPKEGYWHLEIGRLEAGRLIIESEEHHLDGRLILLNAYGRFWPGHKPTEGSMWGHRGELTRELVTQRANLPNLADPEDLDPTEISLMIPKKEL